MGLTLGFDPSLKKPYPQSYPSFSHGFYASQSYILRAFQGEREEAFRNQTYDLGSISKGLNEERLGRLLQLHQSWSVSTLFGFSFKFTGPISFKFVYSCMCFSIVASIFVDEFV